MQNSMSGSVRIECKTEKCPGGFAGDFVFNLTEWVEKFKEAKLTCRLCGKTYTYSRTDIIPTPAKIPPEENLKKSH
jgi:redox-regulated HSP33 family molecular chaperone